MKRIELVLPNPESFSNPLEYAQAIIEAQLNYRKACFAAIDRVPTLRSEHAKQDYKFQRTVHDYLAEHPALLERYKEIGPMALLEL